MRILISGAGIAGPTLANWLGIGKAETTLIERSPQLRVGGYAIDFWGRGYEVAELMGIIPEIRRNGYQIKEFRVVNAQGRRISGFNVDAFRDATDGRYVTIPRSDLVRSIFHQIEGQCETIFGDSIATLNQSSDGVDVTFEHALPRRFDVVIGADGLHSKVRSLVFGTEERFEKFLGYSVAAFEAEDYQPRDEDVYVNYSAPGKQLGRLTLRNNRTLFLFVFADDTVKRVDQRDIQAHKATLRSRFGGLGWECPRILSAMDKCDDLYFDRVSQIRMDRWWEGRVGLIGDAAFCPSLLAGQGSALAMLAAYVLGGELARARGSPGEAFQRYERLLHSFMLNKQNAAEKFAGSFAPKTRAGLFLRNQVTRLLSLPLVARRLMSSTLLDRINLPHYSGDLKLPAGRTN